MVLNKLLYRIFMLKKAKNHLFWLKPKRFVYISSNFLLLFMKIQ